MTDNKEYYICVTHFFLLPKMARSICFRPSEGYKKKFKL